jgi:hypothetical protein
VVNFEAMQHGKEKVRHRRYRPYMAHGTMDNNSRVEMNMETDEIRFKKNEVPTVPNERSAAITTEFADHGIRVATMDRSLG